MFSVATFSNPRLSGLEEIHLIGTRRRPFEPPPITPLDAQEKFHKWCLVTAGAKVCGFLRSYNYSGGTPLHQISSIACESLTVRHAAELDIGQRLSFTKPERDPAGKIGAHRYACINSEFVESGLEACCHQGECYQRYHDESNRYQDNERIVTKHTRHIDFTSSQTGNCSHSPTTHRLLLGCSPS